MKSKPQIILKCWKHAKLDYDSTSPLVQAPTPAPEEENDLISHMNAELAEMIAGFARYGYEGDLISPQAYIGADSGDEHVHLSMQEADIAAEVQFSSEPVKEDVDEEPLPTVSRAEWAQCRATLSKFNQLIPGHFSSLISLLDSGEVKRLLPPMKQLSLGQFLHDKK